MRRTALALLLALLLPGPLRAQEGDYVVFSLDDEGGRSLAELCFWREAGGWHAVRRAVLLDERDGWRRPRVWEARQVTVVGSTLRVRWQPRVAGLIGPLAPGAEVQATYRVGSAGGLVEWLRRDDDEQDAGWTRARGSGSLAPPELELVREARLEDLLGDALSRYEASGLVRRGDELVVAFDNSTRLARIPFDLDPDRCKLVKTGAGGGSSDFEGLTWDPRREVFYALVEGEKHHGDWLPEVLEFDDHLDLQDRFRLDYELPGRGKGCEGLTFLRHDGQDYLLALPEGNLALDGVEGQDPGHGLIEVFRRKSAGKWKHEATVELPPSVAFVDYSGLDLQGGRLVVISQASSLLWVGELDPETWTIPRPGQVYRFPRLRTTLRYPGMEGVAWIGPRELAVVSDRSGAGDSSFVVEEAVHVFRLPPD